MHMVATSTDARSELTVLDRCFCRVHCLTFGAPPVSLLPLVKPKRLSLRKCLFLSFFNEGDPVNRADKAFFKSLFTLLASPPPSSADPVVGDGKRSTPKRKFCLMWTHAGGHTSGGSRPRPSATPTVSFSCVDPILTRRQSAASLLKTALARRSQQP